LKSRRTPCTSQGPNVLGYVHGVGAAAGNSDHAGEEYIYILRKEYCTRYGRAQGAFRIRNKPRGRPVPSDWPPPRRCGQAAWAAAGRPYFFYWGGIPPNCADVFIVPVLVRIYSHLGWLVHFHNRLMSDEQKKTIGGMPRSVLTCARAHVDLLNRSIYIS